MQTISRTGLRSRSMSKGMMALLLAGWMLAACGDKRQVPDVSGIKVQLQVLRFEQDLFNMDTTDMNRSMDQLSRKYPLFLGDMLGNVLGLPRSDSALPILKSFIASYRPVYMATQAAFKDFSSYQQAIEKGLQFTAHYFPEYKLPQQLITFIGPMDALFTGSTASYGDVMTQSGPAIGLQLHLGMNSDVYKAGLESGITYAYQVRRYTPETIPVNVMKNIVDDMFPYKADGAALIEQMIEKGKRLYVLDQLMPYTADSLKIGYTKAQLELCDEHEADIWNFFVKNELVYSIEPTINKEYIEDGPKTQVLGEGVPGYLGLYVGWQIVKTWMKKQGKLPMQELMRKDARALFNEAGYKP